MSSGTQVDLDWTGIDAAQGGPAAPPAGGANGAGSGAGAYLTDEEILGIDPPSPKSSYGGHVLDHAEEASTQSADGMTPTVGARHAVPLQLAPQGDMKGGAVLAMPEWMLAAAGDPKHGVEAQQLWQEHQAFRAAFSSPEEARAIKELFPGGAQEAQTLRQAAQAVDQLDAAIYSGDARAQSEVVAELVRANPTAFRQLFSEAAKVLAGLGQTLPVNQTDARTGKVLHGNDQTPTLSATADERWSTHAGMGQGQPVSQQIPTLRENREGWGTQQNTTRQNSVTAQDPAMEN